MAGRIPLPAPMWNRVKTRISLCDYGITFDKMKNNKKGQSLIHKTKNLLDDHVIYDKFDCPLFVARGWNFNVPTLPQSDSDSDSQNTLETA